MDLSKEPTKLLMRWLSKARACGGQYDPSGQNCGRWMISIDELKKELAKRPHVLNKIEAKKLRQQKAKG